MVVPPMDELPPLSPSRSARATVFVATLIAGVMWIAVKHPFEGPTIYELTTNHGIHRWDFLAAVPSLGALLWWLQAR